MGEWFECKVKYEKTLEDGKIQKVSEPYIVDAINFTEAERRIIEELQPYISGEFNVSDIKRVKYVEIIETKSDSADKWFKCKISFIIPDEKSGKEKRVAQNYLVQASNLQNAIIRIEEYLNTGQLDYNIVAINETLIMDVFHYKENAPEGFIPIEKEGVSNE